MTPRIPRTLVALAVAVAVALTGTLTLASAATATVPPKNCGMMTVKGKRYQIKADQMRCRTAKSHSGRYLRRRSRPSGYRCSSFSGSRLKFRCVGSRSREFFAIKR